MADKEPFGISEQLDCSDCVNHGGDWDCDHVQCRKGADTISRQAAINALGERPMLWVDDDNYTLGARNQYDSNRLAIETVPTVDAVPVVRCKDCKHHHYSVCEIPYCDRIDYGYGWKDEDFCSAGERKDGDGNG